MSKAIILGTSIALVLSDAADTSEWPVVTDAGRSMTVTNIPGPPVVVSFTPPADIPLEYLECLDGATITTNQAAYASAVEAAIVAKLQALGEYGTAIEQGGTTVAGVHFDTDDKTQAKLGNAYQLAQTASSPSTFAWWMSGGFTSFTKAEIITMAPAVGLWVEQVFANIGVHFAAIAALTTLTDVAAYDFTTGWPAGT